MGKMLNPFAGTKYINYAKSVRLYLQKMAELENQPANIGPQDVPRTS